MSITVESYQTMRSGTLPSPLVSRVTKSLFVGIHAVILNTPTRWLRHPLQQSPNTATLVAYYQNW